jgi:hypothetical protein
MANYKKATKKNTSIVYTSYDNELASIVVGTVKMLSSTTGMK